MKLILPELPGGGLDVRFTFVGRHVADDAARRDRILALRHLRSRVTGTHGVSAADPRLDQLLGQKAFFVRGPDERLYIPLKPLHDTEQERFLHPIYQEPDDVQLVEWGLSAVIKQLDAQGDERGILLRTRSGGGKTLAELKAFFDCVHGVGAASPAPYLDGHLPVWINVDAPISKEAGQNQPRSFNPLLSLIRSSAFPNAADAPAPVALDAWLRTRGAPRFLLFLDLNEAAPEQRRLLVSALNDFQREYGSFGHRCIVAYRSADPGDTAMQDLYSTKHDKARFRFFDLETVSAQQAKDYLTHIGRFEAEVANDLGLTAHPLQQTADVIAQRVELFTSLLRRHAGQRESLISTPLLMHFVATLRLRDDGEEGLRTFREICTLWDLYGEVVRQILEFQLTEAGKGHVPQSWREGLGPACVQAALCRIALAILSAENVVGLPIHNMPGFDLDSILEGPPDLGEPLGLAGFWNGTIYQQSASEFLWETSSAGTNPIKQHNEAVKALIEFSLLRADGNAVYFLHDSFLYYFAALALRNRQSPQTPAETDDDWRASVSQAFCSHADRWELPAEFLGGGMVKRAPGRPADDSAGHALALDILVRDAEASIGQEPRPEGELHPLPSLFQRLARGADEGDAVAAALQRVPDWHAVSVRRYAGMLATDVHRGLAFCEWEPGPCQGFAEKLEEGLNQKRIPWVRQVYGPPPSTTLTFAEHDVYVTSLLSLQDGRVVSGDNSGLILIWHPDRLGKPLVHVKIHTDNVTALVELPRDKNGHVRIASGSWDETVKVWDADAPGEPSRTMSQHTSYVTCLAVLPADATSRVRIASGGRDKTVKVWDADAPEEPARTMSEHTDWVNCLAVLPTDGSGRVRIASGSWDNTVKVWDADAPEEPARTMNQHTDYVNCLAVLPADASGRVRIASGSDDETVKVWDADAPEEPARTMDQHRDRVRCLAVLPADGSGRVRIASGSRDKTAKIWDADAPDEPVRTMSEHTDFVLCLAVLPADASGRVRIASGSYDGTVKVWDADAPEQPARTMSQHKDLVECLAVLPADATGRVRIASGSDDKTVKIWDADAPEEPARTMSQHKDLVECLAVLPADATGRVRIASGSGMTVKVWDADAPEEPARTMNEHMGYVSCLAVLPADGSGRARIASGSWDTTVKVWDADAPEEPARTMSEHTDFVRCLAVLPADGSVRVRIASGSGRTVKVWDADAPDEPARTMSQHTDFVTCLAVLPADAAGRVRIASAIDDGTVKVWDAATLDVHWTIKHPEAVWHLCAFADNRLAIAGERFLRIVSLDEDKQRTTSWIELDGRITAMAFAPAHAANSSHPLSWNAAIGFATGGISLFKIEPDGGFELRPW